MIGLAAVGWAIGITTHGYVYGNGMSTFREGSGVFVGLGGYAEYIRTIKAITVALAGVHLVMLVGGIVYIVWLHRARVNAASVAARPLRFGRGWTIGAWFVPFANLVLPPLVVADVRRGLRPDRPGSVGLVWAWWLSVLAAYALTIVGMVAENAASGSVDYVASSALLAGSGALTILSAAFVIALIVHMSRPVAPDGAFRPA